MHKKTNFLKINMCTTDFYKELSICSKNIENRNFLRDLSQTRISRHESLEHSKIFSFDQKQVPIQIELLGVVVSGMCVPTPLNALNTPLKTTFIYF